MPPNTTGKPARRRRVRRRLLALFLALTVLAASQADYRPSTIDRATAPHRYSIVAWELGRLPDKWFHQLVSLWPGRARLTREEQVAQVQEFFAQGLKQRRLERQLRQVELAETRLAEGEGGENGEDNGAESSPKPLPPSLDRSQSLAAEIELIQERRQNLRPAVEATIEAEVTLAVIQEGLVAPWGGVFPPVDAVFSRPPNLLILSPRNRIYRQQATLLKPGLSDQVKAEIEEQALQTKNLSAVVEATGGLSVYPSMVLDTVGLRYALEVVAHEWVHSWLFFRPLGRNFQNSPELLTLNETAATIAGKELGDIAFTALTEPPLTPPQSALTAPDNSDEANVPPALAPGGFDFTAEMRQTRQRAEELLAQGDIAGAEAYMEQRRRHFVANGYNIRKINQAYFAFHGSYATGPGSLSPIGAQLKELRRRSESLSHFLNTIAQFGSYQEFLQYLAKSERES